MAHIWNSRMPAESIADRPHRSLPSRGWTVGCENMVEAVWLEVDAISAPTLSNNILASKVFSHFFHAYKPAKE